jgi:hypothetical protein
MEKALAAALLVVVLCGGGPLGLRCVCVCCAGVVPHWPPWM